MKRLTFFVLVSTLLAACYKNSPTDAGQRLLRLVVLVDSAAADGATVIPVTAIIPANARDSSRTVTFTTSLGTFTDGGQATVSIVAIDSVAQTYLRAPRTVGSARIRAQLGSELREHVVVFDTAFPTRADLQPDSFALHAGLTHATNVTAFLRRPVGQVTPGVEVQFRALQADNGQELGRFGIPTASNADGAVTVRYSAGETTYNGAVRIQALGKGMVVLGETTIEIRSP
jgi:hypothetical protein